MGLKFFPDDCSCLFRYGRKELVFLLWHDLFYYVKAIYFLIMEL